MEGDHPSLSCLPVITNSNQAQQLKLKPFNPIALKAGKFRLILINKLRA